MSAWTIAVHALLALPLNNVQTVEFYSAPITLRPAEVHNRIGKPVRLPDALSTAFKGKTVFVTSFDVDVVEGEGARERSVPLFEAYNHHYVLFIGSESVRRTARAPCAPPPPLSGSRPRRPARPSASSTTGQRTWTPLAANAKSPKAWA